MASFIGTAARRLSQQAISKQVLAGTGSLPLAVNLMASEIISMQRGFSTGVASQRPDVNETLLHEDMKKGRKLKHIAPEKPEEEKYIEEWKKSIKGTEQSVDSPVKIIKDLLTPAWLYANGKKDMASVLEVSDGQGGTNHVLFGFDSSKWTKDGVESSNVFPVELLKRVATGDKGALTEFRDIYEGKTTKKEAFNDGALSPDTGGVEYTDIVRKTVHEDGAFCSSGVNPAPVSTAFARGFSTSTKPLSELDKLKKMAEENEASKKRGAERMEEREAKQKASQEQKDSGGAIAPRQSFALSVVNQPTPVPGKY